MTVAAIDDGLASGASLSEDGVYRYSLWRRWNADALMLTFVMLNPSTADAQDDDPTIRRCIGFARRGGYGGLVVVNLYALRSTDPKGLWKVEDPVGPLNNEVLSLVLRGNATVGIPVVAAWGANARDDRVKWLRRQPGALCLSCYGVTNAGAPKHPLARGKSRIPDDAALRPWPVAS